MLTVPAYTGSFCLFSYISPLLIEVTGMESAGVGAMMLVYLPSLGSCRSVWIS